MTYVSNTEVKVYTYSAKSHNIVICQKFFAYHYQLVNFCNTINLKIFESMSINFSIDLICNLE